MEEVSTILSSISSLQKGCTIPAGQPWSDADHSCEKDCDCPRLLRQLFYQLWHAAENTFRNQQEAMKLFCSRAHFEAHVEEHADLTQALTGIMAHYRMSRCCHEVFAEVEKFSEKMSLHELTLDAELHLHLQRAGAPQERLPVVMTGSASALA
ncbi:MAG: hypothetical protein WC100_01295 [Sterolibacterium sp.]